MTTYITILRGINVSGHKLIKMDTLKKMYESLKFNDVKTYVQSGNVVFKSKEIELEKLEQKIALQIENEFGFIVPIIVMTMNTLSEIINSNPFIKDSTKNIFFLHVTFLASIPQKYDAVKLESKLQNGEALFYTNSAIYLYCPNGYGNTKLSNNFLETHLKVNATTRNWKTTKELLTIANQLN